MHNPDVKNRTNRAIGERNHKFAKMKWLILYKSVDNCGVARGSHLSDVVARIEMLDLILQ